MTRLANKRILLLRILLAAYCLSAAIAIYIQDYSGYLSLPIFNQSQNVYSLFSAVFFIGCLVALVLALTMNARGIKWLSFVFFTFLVCELMVRSFDFFINDRPHGLIGLYYNHDSAILRRPTKTNHFGFNEVHNYTREVPPNTTRMLFLGDSYTFGSGSTPQKSYCDVVQDYMSAHGGESYEVLNAGVPGYSPRDSYRLFRFLKKQGYEYDAVVFSLFLQNDFLDHIEKTQRKAVCGFIERFPQNRFLRWFHPLNSYVSRYAMVAVVFVRLKRMAHERAAEVGQVSDTGAVPDEDYKVNFLVFERLKSNYLRTEKRDYRPVFDAIDSMRKECACPFFLVVIPDQLFGDKRARRPLTAGINEADYDFMRYYNWLDAHFHDIPVLDVTTVIQQCEDCYIRGDMHLNDKGNLLLGETVGRFLLEQLPKERGEEAVSDTAAGKQVR